MTKVFKKINYDGEETYFSSRFYPAINKPQKEMNMQNLSDIIISSLNSKSEIRRISETEYYDLLKNLSSKSF